MDSKTRIKILELSFNIMEDLLMSKEFKDKQEVMSAIKNAVEISNKNESLPTEVKLAYADAYRKLETLTWDEIVEIKDIINAD